MGAEYMAVWIDHLRLDPQTKLHTEAANMRDERSEAFRILDGIGPPVPEPGAVVVAPLEPAVVQNEALDAQRRGLVCQLAQALSVVVEVDRLPRVEMHRARPHRAA